VETELSFLLTLLLEHKLPKATQGAIKDRLKKIQEAPAVMMPIQRPLPHAQVGGIMQAPSTQRLLAEQGLEQAPQGITPITPVIRVPPAEVDKETGRARIATGNGTSGPRKW
jgi:hypothetical protein